MSTDTVDDLHAAEDFAGRVVAQARDLLLWIDLLRRTERPGAVLPSSYGNLRAAVTEWDSYCRPSCNPNDDGPHDEVCEEGPTCGCPCRARAEAINVENATPIEIFDGDFATAQDREA